jgi:hypothetical protein
MVILKITDNKRKKNNKNLTVSEVMILLRKKNDTRDFFEFCDALD